MYQPKIREDLIPRLYRLARARKMPMTRMVSKLIEDGLCRFEQQAEEVCDPPADEYRPAPQTSGEGR